MKSKSKCIVCGTAVKRNRQYCRSCSESPLYGMWQNLKQKCFNHGIYLYGEWGQYRHFAIWMLLNGWKKGLTVLCNNIDDGYTPNNCTVGKVVRGRSIPKQVTDEKTAIDHLLRLRSKSTEWHKITGVYLIIRDGMVVYVGQSRNLMRRLQTHHYGFGCEIKIIMCDDEDRFELETKLIRKYSPMYNNNNSPRDFFSRVGLYDGEEEFYLYNDILKPEIVSANDILEKTKRSDL